MSARNKALREVQDVSPLTRLRAVLDDLERVAADEEWLGVEVVGFISGREASQRDLRRCLAAQGRFARAVELHPELGVDVDLGPESISALEAVDPEAAAAVGECWHRRDFASGRRPAVFVFGEKTVRLYMDGSYVYTLKAGSSVLVNYWNNRRRWEPKDWFLWPLEDVVDIAPRVLEEYSELAEAWRRNLAGTTEQKRDV